MIYPIIEALPDQPQKKGLINIVKRFVEGSHLPLDGGHLRWQYFSSAEQDARLFNDRFKGRVKMDPFAPIRALRSTWAGEDRMDQEIYVDLRFTMPDSVLMKVDKMSMAHALEIRVPFLDHRFVEFTASLPGDWKLKGFRTKAIFREALERLAPRSDRLAGETGLQPAGKKLAPGGSQRAIDNGAERVPGHQRIYERSLYPGTHRPAYGPDP